MARTPVLPLPDDAVRRILAHVDELRLTFPPSRGLRPFLAAFLRLVYDATGKVYGAGVTRKLLQLYAPEYRPSTVTLHDEIVAFRESRTFSGGRPSEGEQTPTRQVEDSGLLAGIHRMLSQGHWPGEASHDIALVRALEAENDRLRAMNAQLEIGLQDAHQEQTRLVAVAAALKAEAQAKSEALEQMTARVDQLAQAVQAAQEQVAASHRFALGRIEDSGAESRQLREQLRLANAKIDALRKQVNEEQNMSAALRQALNAQRSQQ